MVLDKFLVNGKGLSGYKIVGFFRNLDDTLIKGFYCITAQFFKGDLIVN